MLPFSICVAVLLCPVMALAETGAADSPLAQSLLSEIRLLRQDLQIAASTIQRVQIAMYRVQAQVSQLDRATQRVEQARGGCMGMQWQRKNNATEMEQAEARRANAQSQPEQKAAEAELQRLRSFTEQLTSQEQQCQIEQAEADSQFRLEQAKMNDLQDQLEKLDRVLASYGKK